MVPLLTWTDLILPFGLLTIFSVSSVLIARDLLDSVPLLKDLD